MTTVSQPDSTTHTALIDSILEKLRDLYVFPEVAAEIETDIRARLDRSEYDSLALGELCPALTEQMQAISHDKHLRVFYSDTPRPPVEMNWGTDEWYAHMRLSGSLSNFGLQKVEILPGNIGYLDIRHFFMVSLAGETAVAAMNFLAHTSALIIDLRQCVGGDAATVALITSYLFDEQVHLNDFYLREGNQTFQSWTLPYVPGRRYGDKPVFVLTSDFTFSGGEEFSYNLKNLKRATIVGETTKGGAHPGQRYAISEQVEICIPMGRAINPISGTNWEGTGVTPDVELPQAQALEAAYQLALREVLARIEDQQSGPYKTLREEIEKNLEPTTKNLEPRT
ncbi:MAG TPA: S41 family peptidase [Herpetosiphonaceae bacterium]